MAAVTKIRCC